MPSPKRPTKLTSADLPRSHPAVIPSKGPQEVDEDRFDEPIPISDAERAFLDDCHFLSEESRNLVIAHLRRQLNGLSDLPTDDAAAVRRIAHRHKIELP